MPVAHGEGRFYADDATLDALERDGQVLFRYVDARGRAGRPGRSGQPERLAARDRRRPERGRQRRRPDAPSGTGRRRRSSGSEDGLAIIRSLVESAARAANAGPVAVGAAGPR